MLDKMIAFILGHIDESGDPVLEAFETFTHSKAYVMENGVQPRSARDIHAEFDIKTYGAGRGSKERHDDVKGFLMDHFETHADSNPQNSSKYIHTSFFDLYHMYYINQHCLAHGIQPVSYPTFMKIKTTSFPHFKRSRRNKASKGWDHIRCADCEYYDRAIRKAPVHGTEKRNLEKLYEDHLEKQYAHRLVYYRTRAKSAREFQNLSMIIDAAGGAGTTHSPRMKYISKSCQPRHKMMKIKLTVAKIHGYGSYTYINFNRVETLGGNLTVDLIMRTIYGYMKNRGLRKLRNVYIQLDNVVSNKVWVIYAALGVLILKGVIKKAKIAYLLVGHTHEDVDALIAVIAQFLRPTDMFGLSDLREALLSRIKSGNARMIDVFTYIGIPDYNKIFPNKEINPQSVTGLCDKAKQVLYNNYLFSINYTNCIHQMYYRSDCPLLLAAPKC